MDQSVSLTCPQNIISFACNFLFPTTKSVFACYIPKAVSIRRILKESFNGSTHSSVFSSRDAGTGQRTVLDFSNYPLQMALLIKVEIRVETF